MKSNITKIVYGLLFGSLLTSTLYANATTNSGSVVINLAGKQRMLTQKMSKEALLIIKGIEPTKNRETLKETISLFDTTLHGLKDGNKTLNLPITEEKEIVNKLEKEIALWNIFKKFLDKVVEGEESKNTLKAIEMANMPLLKLMDNIVHLYEKKYSSNLSPNIAKTINLAGRERMLIQKMTKELLLIANNVKSDEYIKSLQTNGLLFENKLTDLMEEKESINEPKLVLKIKDIQELWSKYQNIILNTELSKSGVKVLNENEKNFIEKMSKKLVEVALLIDSKRYQINLSQTAEMFDSTLTALIKGDQELGIKASTNQDIQKQLKIVKNLWKEYQPTIQKVDTSTKGLQKAMEINMPLLKEMNKAVKLYEQN